jgi:Lon protease-like protein
MPVDLLVVTKQRKERLQWLAKRLHSNNNNNNNKHPPCVRSNTTNTCIRILSAIATESEFYYFYCWNRSSLDSNDEADEFDDKRLMRFCFSAITVRSFVRSFVSECERASIQLHIHATYLVLPFVTSQPQANEQASTIPRSSHRCT